MLKMSTVQSFTGLNCENVEQMMSKLDNLLFLTLDGGSTGEYTFTEFWSRTPIMNIEVRIFVDFFLLS